MYTVHRAARISVAEDHNGPHHGGADGDGQALPILHAAFVARENPDEIHAWHSHISIPDTPELTAAQDVLVLSHINLRMQHSEPVWQPTSFHELLLRLKPAAQQRAVGRNFLSHGATVRTSFFM